MDKNLLKALMVGGGAAAGGAGGSWAAARLGATYGYRLGPWGIVAGAVLGALAGAALTKTLAGDDAAAADIAPEEV